MKVNQLAVFSRSPIEIGLCFILCFFLFSNCQNNSDRQKSKSAIRPNVLFIALDDLNDWAEPLGGNTQARTPFLQDFAKEAVNFSRAYCASPGCNPSRSALLTGMHTYNSGMYSNYQDWRKIPAFKDIPTLPRYFRENGYYTAGAGKIFHYSQVDSLAWDDYYPAIMDPMPADIFPDPFPANMPRFKYMYNMFDWAPLDIPDSETGDFKSVEFIAQQLQEKRDEPFFLACGIYRPHLPWFVPQKYFDLFPLSDIKLPELLENDTADLGIRAKEIMSRGGNYHKHVVEAGQWEKAVQGYLASIAYADAMTGKLLNSLKNSSYAENTIVIIWSDHGWQLGEKMHWRKFALWENVIRSLMMIKVPEGIVGLPGGNVPGIESDVPASLLDIFPTLLELCQMPELGYLDGQSLVPLLKNPSDVSNRPIISTYDYGDYSIRYQEWHYIHYIDGSEELYNLEADPHEWHNIAVDPKYRDIKQKLAEYLPQDAIDLPDQSLLKLQEHHIPPVRSLEYYHSMERKEWMRRFE